MSIQLNVKIEFPSALKFLFEPARYKVAHGGRGAAKSWGFAHALLIKAMEKPIRILCARELQLSLQDSVHKLLCDRIMSLGLSNVFDTQRGVIRCASGSEFIFSGVRSNVNKIRSMEGIDICWVEEAETVSEESWSILIPTIRKDGSEIWVSFNPREERDPTYQRFVKSPPPESIVRRVCWQDNPWFPKALEAEKDYLFRVDPEAAAHVWDGETKRIGKANVLAGKVIVEPFFPRKDWDGPYQGIDWGFAVSPTVMIRCWIHEKRLYIEHEAYGVGVEIDETPKLFDSIPDARKYVSRADCARPETISHMQRNGYPLIEGCKKWQGSVEDGVAHLRGYEKIVIHPRCPRTAEQARLWSYKTDRLSGDVLPVLIDLHDDCWDATRYALGPMIKQGDGIFFA